MPEMGSTALWLMLLLGAYHGINPGMGWLFAVALGMQEQKGSAVAKVARPDCARPRVGHRQRGAGCGVSRHGAAAGGHPLFRRRDPGRSGNLLAWCGHHHPRWVRMQVGFRDLTVWSFLMASAHGAGLMVLPVLLGSSTVEAADHMAGHHHTLAAASPLPALLATGVHTSAYLAVTGLIAWVVYRKFGLALLRKAWLNLNVAWAVALVVTGLVVLVI